MITRYVNTASTPGGDGTTNATSGANRAYASLSAAIAALPGTLPDQWTIYCSGTAADTAGVGTIDTIATATNYLLITTQAADRHAGVWDSSKYRLEVTDTFNLRNNTCDYFRVDGLQFRGIRSTAGSPGASYCVKLCGANNGLVDARLSNCILWGDRTIGGLNPAGFVSDPPVTGGIARAWNNIVYGWYAGAGGLWGNAEYYNNTLYGNDYNCVADGPFLVVNNLCSAPLVGSDYVGTFKAGSSNNASSDGTAPGTSARTSQTFSFADSANKNFHLLSTDTGAKGFGLTDPGSGLYSDDIDGQTRSGSWDIGADQYVASSGSASLLTTWCG